MRPHGCTDRLRGE